MEKSHIFNCIIQAGEQYKLAQLEVTKDHYLIEDKNGVYVLKFRSKSLKDVSPVEVEEKALSLNLPTSLAEYDGMVLPDNLNAPIPYWNHRLLRSRVESVFTRDRRIFIRDDIFTGNTHIVKDNPERKRLEEIVLKVNTFFSLRRCQYLYDKYVEQNNSIITS